MKKDLLVFSIFSFSIKDKFTMLLLLIVSTAYTSRACTIVFKKFSLDISNALYVRQASEKLSLVFANAFVCTMIVLIAAVNNVFVFTSISFDILYFLWRPCRR